MNLSQKRQYFHNESMGKLTVLGELVYKVKQLNDGPNYSCPVSNESPLSYEIHWLELLHTEK